MRKVGLNHRCALDCINDLSGLIDDAERHKPREGLDVTAYRLGVHEEILRQMRVRIDAFRKVTAK